MSKNNMPNTDTKSTQTQTVGNTLPQSNTASQTKEGSKDRTEFHPTKDPYGYLENCGWTKVGTDTRGEILWEDPAGISGEKYKVIPSVQLPLPGGGSETIKQCHTPPVPWSYTTLDAVALQQARDRSPKQMIEYELERKRKEVRNLEAMLV